MNTRYERTKAKLTNLRNNAITKLKVGMIVGREGTFTLVYNITQWASYPIRWFSNFV